MSPTPADIAHRITRPRPLTAESPVDPNAEWVRCPCGKIYSDTRGEAERKAAIAADRHHRHCPVRFYVCEEGAWHWSEKFTAVLDCECGHRAYVDEQSAQKAARKRTMKARAADRAIVNAVAYQCQQERWHVILYPVGEELGYCPCHQVSYRNAVVAGTMLAYLNHPDRLAPEHTPYTMYLCPTHGHLHLARPDRVPTGAFLLDGDQ